MLRSKSQNMTPRAKKFFVRSTCFAVISSPSSARALRVLIGISWTLYSLREPSSSGLVAYPAFERLFGVNASELTMIAPPLTRSGRFALQGGRVHRHEHVGRVARRVDRVGAEADLEARDAREGPGGSPDLRRVVRQRADVVPERGRALGELAPGDLHAVAGVAGEAHGDAVQLLDLDLVLGVGLGTDLGIDLGGGIGGGHLRSGSSCHPPDGGRGRARRGIRSAADRPGQSTPNGRATVGAGRSTEAGRGSRAPRAHDDPRRSPAGCRGAPTDGAGPRYPREPWIGVVSRGSCWWSCPPARSAPAASSPARSTRPASTG